MSVVSSFAKAVVLWILVYVLIVHLFAFWKLTTMEIKSHYGGPQSHVVTKYVEEVLTEDEQEELNELKGRIQKMNDIIAHGENFISRVEHDTVLIEKQQKLLNTTMNLAPLFEDDQDDESIDLNELQALFSDMVNISLVEELDFDSALEELAEFIKTVENESEDPTTRNISWPSFNAFLQSFEIIDWEKSLTPPANCSSLNVTASAGPSEAEVQERVEAVRDAIHDRLQVFLAERSDWPVSLRESSEQVEAAYFEIISAHVASFQESLPEVPSSTEETATGCVSTDKALGWLAVALNAMYRKQDIRQALIQEIRDGTLILDAILPEPNPALERSTTNLRHLLDTPLTHQASQWIDYVLEHLSGYNDLLDYWLDKIFQHEERIGSSVVHHVLQTAGKFAMPNNIKEKLQRKA
jgi:hypothetical protein